MQTDSSARRTCIKVRSAVEWAATVLMPNSLQARKMRRAISPRLAMSTFSSMGIRLALALGNDDERLVVFHRLTVFHQDGFDHAGAAGFDLVHHLHGFDDADHVGGLHLLAHFHEGTGTRRGRTVEGADHRRF